MRQPWSLLVAFSAIFCFLTATAKAQDQALQLGTPIERQLSAGQTFTFTVTLQENQLAQVAVDQRGIDVVIHVSSPDGKNAGDFDSPNGDNGIENVTFIAASSGTYRLAVSPLNKDGASPGKFEIKLIEVRDATEQELKASKNLDVVRAKGIALFRDMEPLITTLHTPQSRVRIELQAAQILWDVDEKRASKYLNDAMTGVKEFVATADPGAQEYSRDYGGIREIRSEIIRVLVLRDPEAALSFFYSSQGLPNPFGNERDEARQERDMELFIANQMMAKDPKRTLEIARHDLKDGYSAELVNTILTLRQKEPELASELAAEVANKVLNEKLLKNPPAGDVTADLISACNAKPTGTQDPNRAVESLLPEETCRDLFQKAFDEALSFQIVPNGAYTQERQVAWVLLNNLRAMGQDLDTRVDGGAAAVEKRFKELNNSTNPYQETSEQIRVKVESGAVDAAMESVQKAPEELRDQLYVELAGSIAAKGDPARARQILNENVSNAYQRRQVLANMDQQELSQEIARGRVQDALRTIAALKTPRERANLLSQIARQIGTGQKRADAINSLEQARALLAPGPQAQDQEQMFALMELARAFSRYDVKRAFEIIDPLVDQLNDLCAAARVLDGFGVEFYENDELTLQNGNNLATSAMQLSNVLGSLAITNFDRAKLTSDRLRLPELRLHAYLDIAQQTVDASKQSQSPNAAYVNSRNR